jgi:hypothetical protein
MGMAKGVPENDIRVFDQTIILGPFFQAVATTSELSVIQE